MTLRRLALLLLALGLAPAAAGEEPPAIPNDLLRRCARAVERVRGAPFERPVPASAVTADAYRDRMLADMERLLGGEEGLRGLEALLRDLDQIGPDDTIRGIAVRFFPSSVAASYDAGRGRIEVLRGFRSASLLCHELTHALDDQRFDLMAMFRDGPLEFDRLLALGALVEGSAQSLEMTIRSRGAFPLAPVLALEWEGERRIASYLDRHRDVPRILARAFIFQYFTGLVFVETVKRRRLVGWPALDQAFRDPPRTTEQVLHPAKYFAREGPRPLAPVRAAGWRTTAENVLGELGTTIVLEGFGRALPEARRAAAGWGADRVAHLEDGAGRSALAWVTTWDTEDDAVEFLAAAAAGLRGTRRSSGERLHVSRHGRGLDLLERRGRRVTLLRGVPAGELATLRDSLRPR